MKIAFADFSGWNFHVGSVETTPMGGSQSAACYLARALAEEGVEIFFITLTSEPGYYHGVHCLSWRSLAPSGLRSYGFDVFVCVLGAGNGVMLRGELDRSTRLVLWTQHRCDQVPVQELANAAERDAYDAFAFVSEWQRGEYIARFGLERDATNVLRNAVAPAFLEMAGPAGAILPRKAEPPVLAYTSTPFRGLDLLLEAFPVITSSVPGTRLKVFSSMKVYQVPPAVDHLEYGSLYERCRRTQGVEYLGSLPQPALATEMLQVSVLAYPNTFPETSCISVLEAMASGCQVVTSDLGALPETSAGFAELVPVNQSREQYVQQFADRVVKVLRRRAEDPVAVEALLQRQVEHIRQQSNWKAKATEWIAWLRLLGNRD